MTVLGANAKSDYSPGGRGPSNALAFPNIHELFGSKSNAAVAKIQSKLDDWAESQAKLGGGISAKALKTIFKKQSDLIINKKAPVAEFFFDNGYPEYVFCFHFCVPLLTGRSDIGLLVWPLLPFSRGSVKVTVRCFTTATSRSSLNEKPFLVEGPIRQAGNQGQLVHGGFRFRCSD